MVPVVFLDAPGGDYWRTFERFIRDQLLARGMIDSDDQSLYRLTDSVDEAVDEILQFFRVYDSMRYVHDNLVLRLNAPPSRELLEHVNTHFADILTKGRFALGKPLPEEKDEPDLADLPRLIFRFNRRSNGRLRQLIDCLNRGRPGY